MYVVLYRAVSKYTYTSCTILHYVRYDAIHQQVFVEVSSKQQTAAVVVVEVEVVVVVVVVVTTSVTVSSGGSRSRRCSSSSSSSSGSGSSSSSSCNYYPADIDECCLSDRRDGSVDMSYILYPHNVQSRVLTIRSSGRPILSWHSWLSAYTKSKLGSCN